MAASAGNERHFKAESSEFAVSVNDKTLAKGYSHVEPNQQSILGVYGLETGTQPNTYFGEQANMQVLDHLVDHVVSEVMDEQSFPINSQGVFIETDPNHNTSEQNLKTIDFISEQSESQLNKVREAFVSKAKQGLNFTQNAVIEGGKIGLHGAKATLHTTGKQVGNMLYLSAWSVGTLIDKLSYEKNTKPDHVRDMENAGIGFIILGNLAFFITTMYVMIMYPNIGQVWVSLLMPGHIAQEYKRHFVSPLNNTSPSPSPLQPYPLITDLSQYNHHFGEQDITVAPWSDMSANPFLSFMQCPNFVPATNFQEKNGVFYVPIFDHISSVIQVFGNVSFTQAGYIFALLGPKNQFKAINTLLNQLQIAQQLNH